MATGVVPIVVTGARHELMETDLTTQDVHLVHNPDWESGMGSSIAAGVQQLRYWYPAADGCLITLVDQPLITVAILDRFINAFRKNRSAIIAASYLKTLGVPAIFSRTLFAELEALLTGGGAKKVIKKHPSRVLAIACPEAGHDIDTPEDWERFLRNQRNK